ncbi:hypothetical protein EXIGLDRAFT_780743 [Exidia glandulosa HHB12029]|uniref:DUF6533 domain-containing protein n=1 Tax=Exidia glandulosa HHB12029 TaxID=1314781 RepID=A0A165BGV9_EXIGL|nr:hypothetical protein EXIGLDRAFT_780743 [Exidia glandulosa HHB12029]
MKMLYVIVGVLILCDYVETFADEVELVWTANWRAGKILFIAIRYSIFPLLVFDVVNELCYTSDFAEYARGHPWHQPRMSSASENNYVTWGIFCGILLTQIVFALRTWAIWSRPRWLTIFMSGLFAITLGAEIYFVAAWYGNISAPTAAVILPSETVGSIAQPIAIWIVLSVFDAVLMTLTLVKTIEQFKYRSSGISFITIVYQDGILYLLAVLATSMVYLGVALIPNEVSLMLVANVQYKFYTILACRIMLHIRRGMVVRMDNTFVQTTHRFAFQSTTQADTNSHPQCRDGAVEWFGQGLTDEAAVSSILVIGLEPNESPSE